GPLFGLGPDQFWQDRVSFGRAKEGVEVEEPLSVGEADATALEPQRARGRADEPIFPFRIAALGYRPGEFGGAAEQFGADRRSVAQKYHAERDRSTEPRPKSNGERPARP